MMDFRVNFAILVIALSAGCIGQSVPNSPCPNVFTYEPPGSEPGRWYGVITLSTDITLHGLWLNVVLDAKADILGNWVGDVTTTDNMDFKVENTKMKIQPGPAQSIRFFVQYNQLNKIPRLTTIRLNGREICNINSAQPAVERPNDNNRPVDEFTQKPQVIYLEKPTADSSSFSSNRPQDNPSISRPQGSNSNRPQDTSTARPGNRQDEKTKPVQGRPSGDGPVYIPTQNPPIEQSNVNPYSISDGQVNAQSVGTQTNNGKPQGTQNYQDTQNKPRPNAQKPRPSSTSPPYTDYSDDRGGGQVNAQNVGTQTNNGKPQGTQNYQNTQNKPRPNAQKPRPSSTSDSYTDYPDDSAPVNDDDYFSGGLPTITKMPGSGPGQNTGFTGNNNNQGQCGKVVRNATPLIVNGRPTLEGQWPWQIALYQTQTVDSKYICGGTLISRSYVLTAAHCITRKGSNRVVNKNTLTVYLGKHNLRTSIDGVQIKFVGQIKVHPQYNASSYSKDLGLLYLRDPATFSEFVRPACLWPEDRLDLGSVIGTRGSVVGWGFDDKGVATEELSLVEMPVVDQETCIRSYSEFFARFTSEYTYCAGFRDGTSVCNGDSGGGMVFRFGDTWYLRGLVSLSVARQNEYRCDPTHYVVFTDLAKFLPWIKDIVGNDL